MSPKKFSYTEGDWFAVPLRDSGYALGLVARMDGEGGILGYFFGPGREPLPSIEDIVNLSASQAILIRHCGDTGLIRGTWPIIGRTLTWSRMDWPLPAFARIALDESWALRVEYSEADINVVLREVLVSLEEAHHLPEDGVSGYGALEIRLTKLLT